MDNSAPFAIRPLFTYKSGNVVQTNGATSWNEWAEGNYFEPDLRFGHGSLNVIKEELNA